MAQPTPDVPAPRNPARPPRLVYLAGPGDVINTYRHWAAGRDDPSQVSFTMSGQFYDVAKSLGAASLVISQHSRAEQMMDGSFRIEHRPNRFKNWRGPFYLLGSWLQGLRLTLAAIRFRPDVVIASEGMAAWPPLRVLRWFGIQLVPCVLCVLWLKQHPPTGKLKRFLMRLDGKVFSKSATATISMSGEITRQITQLAGNHPRPILEFVPTYQPQTFAAVSPPPAQRDPFAVLFVGRIERAKGVFDLLEIARRLRGGGGTAVRFDLCGTGSELPALRAAAAAANLSDSFICHGHCDRPAMRERMSACHAMIVPTTSWFVEGFNQVVAEAAMAGRPVITSSICPAIERVGPAVVEVPPDDVQAYVAAIQRLRDDVNFYEQKRAACAGVAQQFYDLKLGWAATLLRALELAGTVG